MKNKLIVILICASSLHCTNHDNNNKYLDEKSMHLHNLDPDSLLLKKLMGNNVVRYIGYDVQNFMNDSLFKNYIKFTFMDKKPGSLTSILFSYSQKVTIEVRLPNEFIYSKKFSTRMDWDINLVKKEIISDIKLFFNDIMVEY
jgi:hypothetical protein